MRTRIGLNLRSIGEAPGAADAMGISVAALPLRARARRRRSRRCRRRLLQPLDHPGLDGRRLARRRRRLDRDRARDLRLLARRSSASSAPTSSAALSGGLPSALQAHGYKIKPEVLNALPYIMTIVVLVLVSSVLARRRWGAPAALGIAYVREER